MISFSTTNCQQQPLTLPFLNRVCLFRFSDIPFQRPAFFFLFSFFTFEEMINQRSIIHPLSSSNYAHSKIKTLCKCRHFARLASLHFQNSNFYTIKPLFNVGIFCIDFTNHLMTKSLKIYHQLLQLWACHMPMAPSKK